MVESTSGFHFNPLLFLRFHRRLFRFKSYGLCSVKILKGFNLNNRGCKPTGNVTNEATTLKGLNNF
jgi:hypothetical protein